MLVVKATSLGLAELPVEVKLTSTPATVMDSMPSASSAVPAISTLASVV
jgi:hypothetical protein